ncbi:hypothetical protein MINTMi198_27440 [Mycobacterium intracellulare M.i.198]|nr:hypothetical protein MINTMi198_27440 [Mycobacterium intracellulare M.i.198]
MKERLHWFAMHGFIRGAAAYGARRGDVQARLIADPAVAADPVRFYDEVRARGKLVKGRVAYLTADHALAHELLRSDDFRVVIFGSNLPAPLRWLERRTRDDLLHPLRAPSLLAVEPPTTPATARPCRRCSRPGRSPPCVSASSRRPPTCWSG